MLLDSGRGLEFSSDDKLLFQRRDTDMKRVIQQRTGKLAHSWKIPSGGRNMAPSARRRKNSVRMGQPFHTASAMRARAPVIEQLSRRASWVNSSPDGRYLILRSDECAWIYKLDPSPACAGPVGKNWPHPRHRWRPRALLRPRAEEPQFNRALHPPQDEVTAVGRRVDPGGLALKLLNYGARARHRRAV